MGFLRHLIDTIRGLPSSGERPADEGFDADPAVAVRAAAAAGRLVFVMSSRPMRFLQGLPRTVDLLRSSEPFQESIARNSLLIRERLGWSLPELLDSTKSTGEQPEDRLEPAMTAVQIGLCEVLSSAGIVPAAVLTMSGGEFAAAYATKALPSASAMELSCAWSRAFKDGVGTGAMIQVRLDADEALAIASLSPGPVYLACDFSPGITFLSTTHENLEPLIGVFSDRGLRAQRMPYGAGYHSELMEGWTSRAVSTVARVGVGTPRIPFYSAAMGGRALALDAAHWTKVIAGSAFFHDATLAILRDSYTTFLEINAVENLAGPIQMTAASCREAVRAIPLITEQKDRPCMLENVLKYTEAKRVEGHSFL